jgi:hypothetical protein
LGRTGHNEERGKNYPNASPAKKRVGGEGGTE